MLKDYWQWVQAYLFFFCSIGEWTQGLILAGQALYLLNHPPSPKITFLGAMKYSLSLIMVMVAVHLNELWIILNGWIICLYELDLNKVVIKTSRLQAWFGLGHSLLVHSSLFLVLLQSIILLSDCTFLCLFSFRIFF
jgi:hypothetical protein